MPLPLIPLAIGLAVTALVGVTTYAVLNLADTDGADIVKHLRKKLGEEKYKTLGLATGLSEQNMVVAVGKYRYYVRSKLWAWNDTKSLAYNVAKDMKYSEAKIKILFDTMIANIAWSDEAEYNYIQGGATITQPDRAGLITASKNIVGVKTDPNPETKVESKYEKYLTYGLYALGGFLILKTVVTVNNLRK